MLTRLFSNKVRKEKLVVFCRRTQVYFSKAIDYLEIPRETEIRENESDLSLYTHVEFTTALSQHMKIPDNALLTIHFNGLLFRIIIKIKKSRKILFYSVFT